jgi:hypothetical protein
MSASYSTFSSSNAVRFSMAFRMGIFDSSSAWGRGVIGVRVCGVMRGQQMWLWRHTLASAM